MYRAAGRDHLLLHILVCQIEEISTTNLERHVASCKKPCSCSCSSAKGEASASRWHISCHKNNGRDVFIVVAEHIDANTTTAREKPLVRCMAVFPAKAILCRRSFADQLSEWKNRIRHKLQHHMLTSLGWDVRRVRWDDWVELELDL